MDRLENVIIHPGPIDLQHKFIGTNGAYQQQGNDRLTSQLCDQLNAGDFPRKHSGNTPPAARNPRSSRGGTSSMVLA